MMQGEGSEIVCLFGCGDDEDFLGCERLVAPDAEEGFVVVDGIECGFNDEKILCDCKGLDTVQCEVLQYAFFCLHSQYVPAVLEGLQGIGVNQCGVWFCVGELLVGDSECLAFRHGGANDAKVAVARWDNGGLYASAQLAILVEELAFVQVGDEQVHVLSMISVCLVLYIYGIAPDILAIIFGYNLQGGALSDLFQFGKETFAIEWRISKG